MPTAHAALAKPRRPAMVGVMIFTQRRPGARPALIASARASRAGARLRVFLP